MKLCDGKNYTTENFVAFWTRLKLVYFKPVDKINNF